MAIDFSQLKNQDFVKNLYVVHLLFKKIFNKKNLNIALLETFFFFVDSFSNGPLVRTFISSSIFLTIIA